jgi:hypothetical protein
MKRPVWAILALAATSACGEAHLGANYGKRVSAVLDAQAADPREGTAIDATDAKTVMLRHHAQPAPQGGGAAVGAVVPAVVAPVHSMQQGNPQNLKLEPKER